MIIDILIDINIKEIKFIVPKGFSGLNTQSFGVVKQELLKKKLMLKQCIMIHFTIDFEIMI